MYEKTVLGNGLRILSSFMPHTRSVSVCVHVGAGSRYEEDAHAGVSHFLEHMLFKGTTRRPSSADISGAIEQLGGVINGSTDREMSTYWCKVARPHFHKALDVLTDLVRDPLMNAGEMEKERSVVQEELSISNDYPNYRVELLIDEMLWPDQPMGRDVAGSRESVNGITLEMLVDWFLSQYISSNVVISVAGNVSHEEVVDVLGPLVKGWPQGTPQAWRPAAHRDGGTPEVRMEHRQTAQAHMCMALPGISSRDPDRYALDLMSTVLGEGMTSRLFLEVREKRGLAYDIHSMASHFRDTGSIAVYFGVDPKKARYATRIILGELRRMKTDVPEAELTRAKEMAKGRMLLRLEDTRVVAGWGGAQELLYGEVLTVDDVVEKVDAVTTEDVERVANQFLAPEKLNLAVVGPYRSDRQFQDLLRV